MTGPTTTTSRTGPTTTTSRTGPTTTTSRTGPTSRDSAGKDRTDGTDVARPTTPDERPTAWGRDLEELARTQEDVTQRARRLVAGDLVTSSTNGGADDEFAQRLLEGIRADLLAQLRGQEQERARRQLEDAARSGEDAVAGLVQGVTTVVRSIVPAALVRPEDVPGRHTRG